MAPGALTERVEVRDPDAVGVFIRRVRPDVVIHTAYRQGGTDAWEVNVTGSANVAAATARVGARLIHLSTDVVFDGRTRAPYTEADRPAPITDYGASKAEAEERVRTAHPGALVIRTSLLLGGPAHEPSKHELAATDPDAVFYEDELRSPIAVGDLAGALIELAGADLTGILHVAGADDVSRAELAELVTGRPVRRVPSSPDRPRDCRLDSSRARMLLATPLRGIRELYTERVTGIDTRS